MSEGGPAQLPRVGSSDAVVGLGGSAEAYDSRAAAGWGGAGAGGPPPPAGHPAPTLGGEDHYTDPQQVIAQLQHKRRMQGGVRVSSPPTAGGNGGLYAAAAAAAEAEAASWAADYPPTATTAASLESGGGGGSGGSVLVPPPSMRPNRVNPQYGQFGGGAGDPQQHVGAATHYDDPAAYRSSLASSTASSSPSTARSGGGGNPNHGSLSAVAKAAAARRPVQSENPVPTSGPRYGGPGGGGGSGGGGGGGAPGAVAGSVTAPSRSPSQTKIPPGGRTSGAKGGTTMAGQTRGKGGAVASTALPEEVRTLTFGRQAGQLAQEMRCAHAGPLSKRGGGKISKGYRKRFFVLLGCDLFYFKTPKEKKAQGMIANVNNYVFETLGDKEFMLVPVGAADGGSHGGNSGGGDLSSSGTSGSGAASARAFHVQARSAAEMAEWRRVLPTAADANTARIEGKLSSTFYIEDHNIAWDDTAALGKGASGVVRKGTWLGTTPVAVKLLNNLPEFIDLTELGEFYTEIETLSGLRHPNIVSMFGYAKKDGFLALVTEFVGGGDLSAAIHGLQRPKTLAPGSSTTTTASTASSGSSTSSAGAMGGGYAAAVAAAAAGGGGGGGGAGGADEEDETRIPMAASLKLQLLTSIANAMVFLHSKDVVHRDLKPGNILVENLMQAKVKVCDFGLSDVRSEQSAGGPRGAAAGGGGGGGGAANAPQVFGSPAYAAPELPKPDHTASVDVFSFGIVMWELMVRQRPWLEHTHASHITDAIAAGKRPDVNLVAVQTKTAPQQDEEARSNVRRIMQDCWAQDPRKRPVFGQVHSALKQLCATLPDEQELTLRAANLSVHTGADGKLQLTKSAPTAGSAEASAPGHLPLDDLVSRVFAGDAVMPFVNWAEAVLPHLITGLPPSAAVSTLACVRDLAADANSLLQRDSTGKLISWFLPLRRDDVPPAPGQAAWRVSDMLALLDTPTFVGFASATEAKDWVVRQDEVGAFLFRFSSQVGMYGLSACWQRGHVGHWRISTAVVSGVPVFTMNSREYSSLQDIIRTHSHPGTPLSAKDSAGVAVNFYLSVAITKRDVLESKESAYM